MIECGVKETKTNMNLFIDKLYNILGDKSYHKIIGWDPDGLAFSIHDPVIFTEVVLPKHFKHNNLFSFIRQLNLYDFHKQRFRGHNQNYENKNFQRNRPELLPNIIRKVKKVNPSKHSSEVCSLDFQKQKERVQALGQRVEQLNSSMTCQLQKQSWMEANMENLCQQNKIL